MGNAVPGYPGRANLCGVGADESLDRGRNALPDDFAHQIRDIMDHKISLYHCYRHQCGTEPADAGNRHF